MLVGFPQKGRDHTPATHTEPRNSLHTTSQSKSLSLGRTSPFHKQPDATNSVSTEGSDPLPSNVILVPPQKWQNQVPPDSTLDWFKANRRPANLETLRPPWDAFVPILAPTSLFAGKLGRYVLNWGQLTDDNWVLNTVRGHCLPLISVPIQQSCPLPGH